jgi:regulator of replication initiation timing
MDSPSSSPSPPVAQLIPRPITIEQHQPQSTQSRMQSTQETTKNKPEPSTAQPEPETTYIIALENKIALLQSELNLLKSTKPQRRPNIIDLEQENAMLKIDNSRLKSYIRHLIEHVTAKDEEKEMDKKGKKVVENDKRSRKRKLSLVCYTRKGTDEVVDVMESSSESSDDNDSDSNDELEYDEDEDEDEDMKTAIRMSMLEGIGSSSKIGSGSMEAGDTIQSMSGLSNGEVEKFGVLDKIKPSITEPLRPETDLVPKHLNNGEIVSPGKELYDSNNHDALKLAGSGESESSSCQKDRPPDLIRSKSTVDASEIMKLNKNEAKLTRKKRKWDTCWGSEEDMLCSLTSNPEMLLEAICALYRTERKLRLWRPMEMLYKGLLSISESDYQKYVDFL